MKLNKKLYNVFLAIGILVFFIVITFIYNQVATNFMNEAITDQTSKIAAQDFSTIKGKATDLAFMLDSGTLDDNDIVYIEEIDESDLTTDFSKHLTFPICQYEESGIVFGGSDERIIYITNESKTKVAKVTNSRLLFENITDGFIGLISTYDGRFIGGSTNLSYSLLTNLLADSSEYSVSDIITPEEGDDSVTVMITLGGVDYLLFCDEFEYDTSGDSASVDTKYNKLYYVTIVNTDNSAISYSTLQNFTYAYFIILLVGFVFVIILVRKNEHKQISLAQLSDQIYSRRIGSLIIRIEKNGTIIKTNNTFYSMIGIYNKEKTKNISIFESVDNKSLLEHFSKGEQAVGRVFNEKKETDVYIRLAPIRNRNNYVIQGQEITEEFLRNKYVEELSSVNQVTRYPNKLKFLITFPDLREVALTKNVSIISINIQKFRDKNKVFGRQIGDRILIETAKLITDNFPDSVVYHFDADFFLVSIVKENTAEIVKYCQNLTEILKHPLSFSDNHIYTSVKMGIYIIPKTKDYGDAEDVLSKSNMALIKARDTYNRDYFIYDKVLAESVQKELQMLEDLRVAIKNKEFMMFYQPQFNIVENRIGGFEALIRWKNEKYKDQSPQVFIELAERNSMINQIGDIVIDLVFEAAETFQKYNVLLSMNVSPIQILQVGFVQNLLDSYEAHHLNSGSVCIEITETFLMENFNMVLEKLKILVNHGFSIHLDDFGTGYSSMLYLADLPADTIKIDKEFVKVVDVDKASSTIVSRLINMAQELDKDIIVEGVETIDQLRAVKRMGANIIQGFLFGHPVDKETALEEVKSPSLMLNKRNQVIRIK